MGLRRAARLPFRRSAASEEPRSADDRHRAEYAIRFQPHCDRHLSRIARPRGLSVLVIGAGNGSEMLWAIRQGASEVLGIDIAPRSERPLAIAIEELGIRNPPPYRIVELGVDDVATLDRRFDLVLSNNTFEHLPDIRNAFKAIRSVVAPKHGRVAIFTDPLFYSSQGAHLPVDSWDHLHRTEQELRESLTPPHTWHGYETLNRMTLTSFLEAVREADFVILELFVVADRALDRLPELLPKIAGSASVTDLALEGIGIELMPPPSA